MKHSGLVAILLLIAGVAAILRVPKLAMRPMHADEAVQAARFRDLFQDGRYDYDPNEFHGPTLPYTTLLAAWAGRTNSFAETTETTYRAVPVAFGVGLVLLLYLFRDVLGRSATLYAALLMAVSPAMVFYSRYYIHEPVLAFFTLGAMGFGWRYLSTRKLAGCLLTGASIGLMQATKETAVLAYLAAGLASVAIMPRLRVWRSRELPAGRPWCWWHLALGLAVAAGVGVVLYSSFFTNPRGPIDAVLTYQAWLARAGGDSPHIHCWSFYLHRLAWWRPGDGTTWTEAFILALAIVGGLASFVRPWQSLANGRAPFVRWLTVYTLTITAIYTVIPYKTPWCLLQFLLGMILLAGSGAATLLQAARGTTASNVTGDSDTLSTADLLQPAVPSSLTGRGPTSARRRTNLRSATRVSILAGLLMAGVAHLTWQASRASFLLPADQTGPYVYAQTSADAVRLADQLIQLVVATEERWSTRVNVIWKDVYYWPLPWYLRRFDHVQWWTEMPYDPAAPIIISSPRVDADLTTQLGDDYIMTGYFEIRPRVLAQLWVRIELWEAHLGKLDRI